MSKSDVPEDVLPSGFANNPQAHLTRMRLDDTYEIEKNGKFIKAQKKIQLDVSELVLRAEREGFISVSNEIEVGI